MIIESLPNAKPNKLFYVVANVVLVNTVNKSCLLLLRDVREKEAGGKWAFPGGKGEHEMVVDGRVNNFLGRVANNECNEETGLSFNPADAQVIADGAFKRKDGTHVFWATLAAPHRGGSMTLEANSFSDYGWFSLETLPPAEDCIGTVAEEARDAIRIVCALHPAIQT